MLFMNVSTIELPDWHGNIQSVFKSASVIGNCSPDHDFKCRSSVSELQTLAWPPSDQHKAEPALIRKHNGSPSHPSMSSGLTPLASQTAMVWS
ncbi:uncharacterized protein TNCV_911971 [Trichonephila clavipes]|nr:uncharacterized protein TNCV_911971 [Trichonephila clavipes]